MKNTIIKDFDINLANLINSALEQGIEISTIILALDKYLFSARILQKDILENEKLNELKQKNNIESPIVNESLEGITTNASSNENGEIA